MNTQIKRERPIGKKRLQIPTLLEIYHKLFDHFGPQHWWPAESPFEVIVGAVLTQNTAWINVEKAIDQLRAADLLRPETLQSVSEKRLAFLIRPSGFFNLKARRLKTVTDFIFNEYDGSLDRMFSESALQLREKLLAVKGLGPETVDSILLYAGEMSFFVIDAYTRRIFSRHQWLDAKASYETLQDYFMSGQALHAQTFNEYHALIVITAKRYCKKQANCHECPLSVYPIFL